MTLQPAIVAILLVASIGTFVEASTDHANCPDQFKQGILQYCHMHLSRYEDATLPYINPQGSLLQRCCQQLGKLDERCRCFEIRQFVQVQRGGAGWDPSRMKRLLQEAPNLPKTCSLGPGLCSL